jgi:hypothetical protein
MCPLLEVAFLWMSMDICQKLALRISICSHRDRDCLYNILAQVILVPLNQAVAFCDTWLS